MSTPVTHAPFEAYRALRVTNPSPYMYFLRLGEIALVGSSPEVLVRRTDSTVEVRPIAGTRPRGANAGRGRALEEELRASEKERAEHVMLVDLGPQRRRARRPSTARSRPTSSMMVERYSQVMHLVSNVRGRRARRARAARRGARVLPGRHGVGRAQGAGDGDHRGAGAACAAASTRARSGTSTIMATSTSCIAIRTLVYAGGRAHWGAGAGIVADSDPARGVGGDAEQGTRAVAGGRSAPSGGAP